MIETRTFGSVFAGIEGFGRGLERAGWTPKWQCEIEPYPQHVLKRHWPNVPLYRDITKMGVATEESVGPVTRKSSRRRRLGDGTHPAALAGGMPERVDLICGGFPCQDLSVAGKRAGLGGQRSGLFWEFMRLADLLKPRWLLLENVPGLFTSAAGRDFAVVLGAMAERGYSPQWRVVDSRYFGVAQRRRRVFIVGHLGAGSAPPVLFEPEGGDRDSATRSKAWAGITLAFVERSQRDRRERAAHDGGRAGGAGRRDGAGGEAVRIGVDVARALGGIGGGQDYGANKGTLIALDVYNQKADESGVTQPVAGGEGGNTMPHVAYSIHPDAIHRDGVAKSDSPDAEGVMRKRDAGLGIQEGIAHTLMSGEPPAVAATLQSGRRPGTSADDADGLVVEGPAWNGEDISPTLDAVKAAKQQMMPERGRFAGVVVPAPRDLFSFVPEIAAPLSAGSNPRSNAAGRRREDDENVVVTHTLKGEGHDASEDGTGRGVPLTVTPLQQPGLLAKQPAVGVGEPGDPMYTLAGMGVHAVAIDKTTPIETTGYQGDQVVPAEGVWPCLPAGGGNNGGGPGALLLADTKPVVTDAAMLRTHNLSDEKKGDVWMSARPGALSANFNEGGNQLQVAVVETDARPMAVRRLLPIECERLQGFPDNWTCLCDTPGIWTCQCPDSPRYKACGNAVTEVVACWIGTRMIEWDRRLLV